MNGCSWCPGGNPPAAGQNRCYPSSATNACPGASLITTQPQCPCALACQNGGACGAGANGPVCNCRNGFTGPLCDVPPACPCQNGGQCDANGGCDCTNTGGWSGPLCNQNAVLCNITCLNSGVCTFDLSGNMFCSCIDGYHGARCGEPARNNCTFMVNGQAASCQEGVCALDSSNNPKCTCFQGYAHNADGVCDHYLQCATNGTNRCSGHGFCNIVPAVEAAVCQCFNGWSGDICDTPLGPPPAVCNGVSCGDHGRCVADATSPSGYKCMCMNGYQSPTSTPPCATAPCPNNCNNHGQCISNNNQFVCVCADGYSGTYCGVAPTTNCPNGCSGFGQCRAIAGAALPVCVCDQSHSGPDCSIPVICTPPCAPSGACVLASATGGAGKCACMGGFSGQDCSTPPPQTGNCNNLNNCNGNGFCVDSACRCKPGYMGAACDQGAPIPVQCPKNCSGTDHGDCLPYLGANPTAGVQPGRCNCKAGWRGDACDQGAPKPCPQNCNLNGKCDFDLGVCQCFTGFGGDSCSESLCSSQNCTTCAGTTITTNDGSTLTCGWCAKRGCVPTPTASSNTCPAEVPFYIDATACPDPLPCPGDCLGRGVCDITTGHCICDAGNGGDDCGEDACAMQTTCTQCAGTPRAACHWCPTTGTCESSIAFPVDSWCGASETESVDATIGAAACPTQPVPLGNATGATLNPSDVISYSFTLENGHNYTFHIDVDSDAAIDACIAVSANGPPTDETSRICTDILNNVFHRNHSVEIPPTRDTGTTVFANVEAADSDTGGEAAYTFASDIESSPTTSSSSSSSSSATGNTGATATAGTATAAGTTSTTAAATKANGAATVAASFATVLALVFALVL